MQTPSPLKNNLSVLRQKNLISPVKNSQPFERRTDDTECFSTSTHRAETGEKCVMKYDLSETCDSK